MYWYNKEYTGDEVDDLKSDFKNKVVIKLGYKNVEEMFKAVDANDPREEEWKISQLFTNDLNIMDD